MRADEQRPPSLEKAPSQRVPRSPPTRSCGAARSGVGGRFGARGAAGPESRPCGARSPGDRRGRVGSSGGGVADLGVAPGRREPAAAPRIAGPPPCLPGPAGSGRRPGAVRRVAAVPAPRGRRVEPARARPDVVGLLVDRPTGRRLHGGNAGAHRHDELQHDPAVDVRDREARSVPGRPRCDHLGLHTGHRAARSELPRAGRRTTRAW